MLNMYVEITEDLGIKKSKVTKIDEDGKALAEFDEAKGKISFDVLEKRVGEEMTIHYSDETNPKTFKIKSVKNGTIDFE